MFNYPKMAEILKQISNNTISLQNNILGKSFLGLLIKQNERHKFMDYAAVERMIKPTEAPLPAG